MTNTTAVKIEVAENTLALEEVRFMTMNDAQLETRLNRITSVKKIEAFRLMATRFKLKKLAGLAKLKKDIFLDN